MAKIKLMNKIAPCGIQRFGDAYQVGENIDAAEADAIMVRSASLHDMTFHPGLQAIARAGAGVNNIPVDKCAADGIVVFNTPVPTPTA